MLIVFGLCLQTCEKEPALDDLRSQAINTYVDIVYASYEDSYNTALNLQKEISNFVANPSEAGLQACKDAWKVARIPYGQTEVYRFYGGPIDDDEGPEGLINSWPLDEAYIDYVKGSENAGIINKTTTYPNITKELLRSLNQTGGLTEEQSEVNVATGYHAIEFLLWGQDFSTSGPGSRSYKDYLAVGGTSSNQIRRGQYLKVVTELLIEDLKSVLDAWKTGADYRKEFTNTADAQLILGRIFTGLGEMSKGELAGERMFVAVDSQDQENEHSCFSDNTHIDIQMNFLGIKNILEGTYTRADGSKLAGRGFIAIGNDLDSTKTNAVKSALNNAESKLNQIPIPFDQAILNKPDVVLKASESLKQLSDRISDLALILGAKF
jgi:putative iron-regulated protein